MIEQIFLPIFCKKESTADMTPNPLTSVHMPLRQRIIRGICLNMRQSRTRQSLKPIFFAYTYLLPNKPNSPCLKFAAWDPAVPNDGRQGVHFPRTIVILCGGMNHPLQRNSSIHIIFGITAHNIHAASAFKSVRVTDIPFQLIHIAPLYRSQSFHST